LSPTEGAALTPMIEQRRVPYKEEAMFYVASSRHHATLCEDDSQTSATPDLSGSWIGSISVDHFPALIIRREPLRSS
jgi:hypothetical protein